MGRHPKTREQHRRNGEAESAGGHINHKLELGRLQDG
jgi:hypothetical protein